MPEKILPWILLSAVFILASCGSPHYKITLKDGRQFMTNSKPEFTEKTGYYRYKGANGKDELVRADEVLMLSEQ